MATGQALERARPQERALAEIAKQLPEGVVQQSPSGLTLINFANPELNRRCIVLAPAATMARSMARLDYRDGLDPAEVQTVIDYLARLGYISKSFPAKEILDLRFFPR